MSSWFRIFCCGLVSGIVTALPTKPAICGADVDEEYEFNKPPVFSRCVSNGTIHLTFDDGPNPALTEPILDLLALHNISATFFINGANIWPYLADSRSAATVRRMWKEGHTIGSHTWSHKPLTLQTRGSIYYEMETLAERMEEILGSRPSLMRPPYGEYNDTVVDILHGELGYKLVLWSISPCDYGMDMDYSLSVFQEALRGRKPEMTPGFISLQHERLPISVEFTTRVIAYIQSSGFRFVNMSECLGFKEEESQNTVSCYASEWKSRWWDILEPWLGSSNTCRL